MKMTFKRNGWDDWITKRIVKNNYIWLCADEINYIFKIPQKVNLIEFTATKTEHKNSIQFRVVDSVNGSLVVGCKPKMDYLVHHHISADKKVTRIINKQFRGTCWISCKPVKSK